MSTPKYKEPTWMDASAVVGNVCGYVPSLELWKATVVAYLKTQRRIGPHKAAKDAAEKYGVDKKAVYKNLNKIFQNDKNIEDKYRAANRKRFLESSGASIR